MILPDQTLKVVSSPLDPYTLLIMNANEKDNVRHSIRQELYNELITNFVTHISASELLRLRDEEERQFKTTELVQDIAASLPEQSEGRKMVKMIDPPEGWKYGFPKIDTRAEGEDYFEWLEANGYPVKGNEQILNMATRYWMAPIEELSKEQRDELMKGATDPDVSEEPEVNPNRNAESDAAWHKDKAERSEDWYEGRNKNLAEIEELKTRMSNELESHSAQVTELKRQLENCHLDMKGLRALCQQRLNRMEELRSDLEASRTLCARREPELKRSRAAHISDMALAIQELQEQDRLQEQTKVLFKDLPFGATFTFEGIPYRKTLGSKAYCRIEGRTEYHTFGDRVQVIPGI